MGLFGGLINTWRDGYQFGDFTKSLLYDLNPIAWVGDSLVQRLQGNDDFDFFNNNPNWTSSSEDPIDQAIEAQWNNISGNSHLNADVQHAEEREDTVNQRTSEDLKAAGLSKYSYSPTSVGSAQHSSGASLLDKILVMQQLAANAQVMKEKKYNYEVSKRLGIRTGDSNPVAPYAALAKILFGYDLSDLPAGGAIQLVKDLFSGSGSGSGSVPPAPSMGSVTTTSKAPALSGASLDTLGALIESGTQINNPMAKLLHKSYYQKLRNFSAPVVGLDEEKGAPDLRADQFEMDNVILKSYSESFWDKLHEACYQNTVKDSGGLNINGIVDYYVDQLVKEGFDKQHAIGIVNTWVERNMQQFGFSFDKSSNLWYNQHRYGN